jgi:hypothetical protein
MSVIALMLMSGRAAEVDRVREVAGDGDVARPVDRDAVAALVAVVREVLRPDMVAVRVELREEHVQVGREGHAERAAAEVGGAAEVAGEVDVAGAVDGHGGCVSSYSPPKRFDRYGDRRARRTSRPRCPSVPFAMRFVVPPNDALPGEASRDDHVAVRGDGDGLDLVVARAAHAVGPDEVAGRTELGDEAVRRPALMSVLPGRSSRCP